MLLILSISAYIALQRMKRWKEEVEEEGKRRCEILSIYIYIEDARDICYVDDHQNIS